MQNYQSLSEEELINHLRASDHSAFTEIYRRYSYQLFVHAYKKLQDEDLAKDAIQELFTWLWHKREIVLAEGNLIGFLYTAMRNKIFNFFAHEKVESKYLESLTSFIKANHGLPADSLIREKELEYYIDKEIQALPTKMRVIFELNKKEQLSYKEIAEKFNVTENNVSKQVRRATKILKKRLGPYFLFFL